MRRPRTSGGGGGEHPRDEPGFHNTSRPPPLLGALQEEQEEEEGLFDLVAQSDLASSLYDYFSSQQQQQQLQHHQPFYYPQQPPQPLQSATMPGFLPPSSSVATEFKGAPLQQQQQQHSYHYYPTTTAAFPAPVTASATVDKGRPSKGEAVGLPSSRGRGRGSGRGAPAPKYFHPPPEEEEEEEEQHQATLPQFAVANKNITAGGGEIYPPSVPPPPPHRFSSSSTSFAQPQYSRRAVNTTPHFYYDDQSFAFGGPTSTTSVPPTPSSLSSPLSSLPSAEEVGQQVFFDYDQVAVAGAMPPSDTSYADSSFSYSTVPPPYLRQSEQDVGYLDQKLPQQPQPQSQPQRQPQPHRQNHQQQKLKQTSVITAAPATTITPAPAATTTTARRTTPRNVKEQTRKLQTQPQPSTIPQNSGSGAVAPPPSLRKRFPPTATSSLPALPTSSFPSASIHSSVSFPAPSPAPAQKQRAVIDHKTTQDLSVAAQYELNNEVERILRRMRREKEMSIDSHERERERERQRKREKEIEAAGGSIHDIGAMLSLLSTEDSTSSSDEEGRGGGERAKKRQQGLLVKQGVKKTSATRKLQTSYATSSATHAAARTGGRPSPRSASSSSTPVVITKNNHAVPSLEQQLPRAPLPSSASADSIPYVTSPRSTKAIQQQLNSPSTDFLSSSLPSSSASSPFLSPVVHPSPQRFPSATSPKVRSLSPPPGIPPPRPAVSAQQKQKQKQQQQQLRKRQPSRPSMHTRSASQPIIKLHPPSQSSFAPSGTDSGDKEMDEVQLMISNLLSPEASSSFPSTTTLSYTSEISASPLPASSNKASPPSSPSSSSSTSASISSSSPTSSSSSSTKATSTKPIDAFSDVGSGLQFIKHTRKRTTANIEEEAIGGGKVEEGEEAGYFQNRALKGAKREMTSPSFSSAIPSDHGRVGKRKRNKAEEGSASLAAEKAKDEDDDDVIELPKRGRENSDSIMSSRHHRKRYGRWSVSYSAGEDEDTRATERTDLEEGEMPPRKRSFTISGIWNEDSHLHVISISLHSLDLYKRCIFVFRPLHPASFDERNVRYLLTTDDGASERSALALSTYMCLASGSMLQGFMDLSAQFFERAKTILHELTETQDAHLLDYSIALSLVAMSFHATYVLLDNNLSALYISMAMNICYAIGALNSDAFNRCLYTMASHPAMTYWDIKHLQKQLKRAKKLPYYHIVQISKSSTASPISSSSSPPSSPPSSPLPSSSPTQKMQEEWNKLATSRRHKRRSHEPSTRRNSSSKSSPRRSRASSMTVSPSSSPCSSLQGTEAGDRAVIESLPVCLDNLHFLSLLAALVANISAGLTMYKAHKLGIRDNIVPITTGSPQQHDQQPSQGGTTEQQGEEIYRFLSALDTMAEELERHAANPQLQAIPFTMDLFAELYIYALRADCYWCLGDKAEALKWALRFLSATLHPNFAYIIANVSSSCVIVMNILLQLGRVDLLATQIEALSPLARVMPVIKSVQKRFEVAMWAHPNYTSTNQQEGTLLATALVGNSSNFTSTSYSSVASSPAASSPSASFSSPINIPPRPQPQTQHQSSPHATISVGQHRQHHHHLTEATSSPQSSPTYHNTDEEANSSWLSMLGGNSQHPSTAEELAKHHVEEEEEVLALAEATGTATGGEIGEGSIAMMEEWLLQQDRNEGEMNSREGIIGSWDVASMAWGDVNPSISASATTTTRRTTGNESLEDELSFPPSLFAPEWRDRGAHSRKSSVSSPASSSSQVTFSSPPSLFLEEADPNLFAGDVVVGDRGGDFSPQFYPASTDDGLSIPPQQQQQQQLQQHRLPFLPSTSLLYPQQQQPQQRAPSPPLEDFRFYSPSSSSSDPPGPGYYYDGGTPFFPRPSSLSSSSTASTLERNERNSRSAPPPAHAFSPYAYPASSSSQQIASDSKNALRQLEREQFTSELLEARRLRQFNLENKVKQMQEMMQNMLSKKNKLPNQGTTTQKKSNNSKMAVSGDNGRGGRGSVPPSPSASSSASRRQPSDQQHASPFPFPPPQSQPQLQTQPHSRPKHHPVRSSSASSAVAFDASTSPYTSSAPFIIPTATATTRSASTSRTQHHQPQSRARRAATDRNR
ncbi:hypothetical protein QOT17_000504 [Balamuthia mandrillaris]